MLLVLAGDQRHYSNPGSTPAVSLLRYNPTLTVDNPLLADPALIDPTTGAPFGGHLTTSMTSSEIFQVPLPRRTTITERTRDSAVCMAGFLNRRMMIDTYGLTEAQADEFFKKPMTIHLNVSGAARGGRLRQLHAGAAGDRRLTRRRGGAGGGNSGGSPSP